MGFGESRRLKNSKESALKVLRPFYPNDSLELEVRKIKSFVGLPRISLGILFLPPTGGA